MTLILGELALSGLIVWVLVHYTVKQRAQRAEQQLRLLERLSAGEGLVRFLETEEGRRVLARFSPRPLDAAIVRRRFLIAGVFLLATAGGFSVLGAWRSLGLHDELFLVAVLLTALALAAFVAGVLVRPTSRSDEPVQ